MLVTYLTWAAQILMWYTVIYLDTNWGIASLIQDFIHVYVMCKIKYLCEFPFLDVAQIFLQLSHWYIDAKLLPRSRQGWDFFLPALIFHDVYAKMPNKQPMETTSVQAMPVGNPGEWSVASFFDVV
jgi:hypothetical protein